MNRVSTKYFVALLSDCVCVCISVYLRAAAVVVVVVVCGGGLTNSITLELWD